MAKQLTVDSFTKEVQVLTDLVMQRFEIMVPTREYHDNLYLADGYVQSFLINLAFDGGSKESMLQKIKDRCFKICTDIQDRNSI